MKIIFFLFLMIFTVEIAIAQDAAIESIRAAIELNKQKDYETSILLCNNAITVNPELTVTYFLRGYNNYLLQNYKEAISDFTKTISKEPDHFEAIYYRAKCRQANGDYLGALSDFNAARELSPSQTTLFMVKGMFSSIFGGTSKK